jgi:hypothetical protein
MKIIDLLNKIANGEEVPKKFRIKGSCFKDLYFEYNEEYNCYDLIGEKFKDGCYVFGYSELNDEVEIITDEKKLPEKLIPTSLRGIDNLDEKIEIERIDIISVMERVNQLIDYLKSKGE